jgi:peptidoglycan/xylan/chitin deacetylase (PgdA/CDA1 family)
MDRRQFITATGIGALLAAQTQTQTAVAAAQTRVLFKLPPSDQPRVAWTVDDGFSDATVAGYIRKLREHPEIKVTFFVTSMAGAWSKHAEAIRELIDLGQVQVANHTHTHAPLTRVRDSKVHNELADCKKFLEDKFGTSGVPFYRPPYGYVDARVRALAAEVGYTDTVLWFGTLADAGKNTRNGIFRKADQYMQAGRIVIGHANHPEVIQDFDSIVSLLGQRGLTTVTLDEAFS